MANLRIKIISLLKKCYRIEKIILVGGSKKMVIVALIGNGLIAVKKFVVAIITGSSAMLSETIHSVVDTSNQALILHGIGLAQKK